MTRSGDPRPAARHDRTDPLDFGHIDTMTVRDLSQARLYRGRQPAQRDAPVILFVHGGYHGAWCYSAWLHYLERAGLPVAAIDLRGHGGLPQGPAFHDTRVTEFADDVVEACRALDSPVVLAGHSLGGLIVGVAASRWPSAGLILLAPSPPGQMPGAAPVTPLPEGAPFGPPPEPTAREKFAPGLEHLDLGPMLSRLCAESPRALNERYRLEVPVDREKIHGPALCIGAGRDLHTLHPPGQDRAVADFYGARYVELPDAVHSMMVTPQWRDGADVILDWYREHFPG